MNRKSLNNDKENKKASNPRRSFGTQKQVLNTSGFLKMTDKEDITDLNDKFSNYIDYVRSVEQTNESLKMESQSIKATYGSEIDSLRKALDDTATRKTKIEYEKNTLATENEKLNNKLKATTNSLVDLKQEYSELKENLINYRKKVDNYESLKLDHDEILLTNNNLSTSLKNEICKRAELENRLATLTEEIEFQKKVASETTNSALNKSANMQNNDNFELRVSEEVESARQEISEEFELYKSDLKSMYEEKYDNLSKLNEKSMMKCTSLYNELVAAKRQCDEANNKLHEQDLQIASLKNRVANNNELVDKITKDHDRYVADMMEDITALRSELNTKIAELTSVTNEKIDIEKEFYMFRSLLENEESRYQVNTSVTSKRKLDDDESTMALFDITSFGNGPVKLLCGENYAGECVHILNESTDDIDLNEWRLEILTDDERVEFRFPRQLVARGSSLTAWGLGADGAVVQANSESEYGMDVALPVADRLMCSLFNDMDKLVTSSELRRFQNKRKILKSNIKKTSAQPCSLM